MKKFTVFLAFSILSFATWILIGINYSNPAHIGEFWGSLYVLSLFSFVFFSIASGYFLGRYLNISRNFDKSIFMVTLGVSGTLSLAVSSVYLFGIGVGEKFAGNSLYELIYNLSLSGFLVSVLMTALYIFIYIFSKFKQKVK